MYNLSEIQKEIKQKLESFGIDSTESACETRLIVEHVTNWSATQQVLNQSTLLSNEALQAIYDILVRREKREPIQYCLGQAWFMGHRLKVASGVFIPRSDTETLVLTVKRRLTGIDSPHIAEIGVGSGAIAIALLKLIPQLQITGIDISDDAIALTKENAAAHQVLDRLTLCRANWIDTLPKELNAIVANPPYIPEAQASSLLPEVSMWEPKEALYGQGNDGLDFYRQLATMAPRHLKPQGLITVEVGDGQAQAVMNIFSSGGFNNLGLDYDLSQLPRVVSAILSH